MIEYAGARTRVPARQGRRSAVEEVGLLRRLDWLLLAATAAVVAFGLWSISGVTREDVPGNPTYYLVRQAIFVAVGAVLFVVGLLVDADVYRRYKRAIYGGTLGLMVLVYLGGTVARGSKRWIDLGFFRFQPSEFGKLLIVLALAGFLADRAKRITSPGAPLLAVGLAAPAIFLVFVQPDVGTALVYGAALAAVLFVAGTRWLHMAVLGLAAVVIAMAVLWWLPAGGVDLVKPYQRERLTSFLNPSHDPRGATYSENQSMIAVGSGGVAGRGVGSATQTSLNYLPEHATDFVFASLAEQRGFLGASFLLLLYLFVVWRGLKVIAVARDQYSAIVAGGIVFAFLFQVFVNVGMTIGIAPITGIPLPFVSVGGSSMVANLLAIGILQGIHARGRVRR
jgi:rod shape determining protein RodA